MSFGMRKDRLLVFGLLMWKPGIRAMIIRRPVMSQPRRILDTSMAATTINNVPMATSRTLEGVFGER